MGKQEIDVKILSKESIKPSSPTPPHLKTFHLSFFDKLFPTNLYPHLIAFYPFVDDHNYHGRVRDLKSSLSETLTRYYPLVGRINKSESFIDCADAGVDFVEAKVSCNLSDILNKPDLAGVLRLLPAEVGSLEAAATSDAVLMVQTSLFECGGLAVCVSLTHNVADACMVGIFVKEWAARARAGAGDIVVPPGVITAVASRFPGQTNSMKPYLIDEEKSYQTRRYVFDSKSINALKAKATSASLQRPSRIEVVAGHIWQSTMKSSLRNSASIKPHVLLQPMNLRKRIHPPLSENSLGSFAGLSFAIAPKSDDNVSSHELESLVGEIRRGYQSVIEWYGRTDTDVFGSNERFEALPAGGVELVVTSGCRYTFYEDSDFGWGEPVWVIVGNNGDTKRKIVTLMDTKDGDGIEAWITLEDHIIHFLDTDKDFLEFAKVNPSVNLH